MWLSKRSRERPDQAGAAEVGTVTIETGALGVYTAREQRSLPVFAPGGYAWRPVSGQQVLVIKSGAAGEVPCVAGALRTDQAALLAPGEVSIRAARGNACIRLRNDGTLELTGAVLVNGVPLGAGQEVKPGGAHA